MTYIGRGVYKGVDRAVWDACISIANPLSFYVGCRDTGRLFIIAFDDVKINGQPETEWSIPLAQKHHKAGTLREYIETEIAICKMRG